MEAAGFPQPDFVAGPVWAEYSALYAARSLTAADAVQNGQIARRYMQEAVPVGTGAMAAVIGAD